MKQPLHSHPALRYCGLSSWPPAWGGAYDPAARIPIGECGILHSIERITEVPALDSPALDLSIVFDGRIASGLLLVDDADLLPILERFLCNQIGQPLEKIGALEIDLPVRAPKLIHVDRELLAQDHTLAEIVRRLADEYRPLAIYLFGSRGRSEHRPDSDYDLMVVVPNDASAEHRTAARAYECLRGIDKAVDILVCTENYFRTRWRVETSLPATVAHLQKLVQCSYDS
jgi:uncharacterized protein